MPAANAMYGPKGPTKALGNQIDNSRPMTTQIQRGSRAPQPTDRLSAAVAKVPGLSAKRRAAVVKAVTPLIAPASDEGRPI
jgi:hypothetical protein